MAQKTARIRSDAVAHRVVADLPSHPIVDIASIKSRYEVSEPAAARAVEQLVELGVLSQANAGQRFRKFIAHDISNALDDFAQRSGRREWHH